MSNDTTLHVKTQNDTLVLRTGEAEKIYQYKGYEYYPRTAESFIKLLHAKGNKENSIIFIDDERAIAIMDDTVRDRKQDEVIYGFQLSEAADEWRQALIADDPLIIGIKDFADFLKRRPEGEVIEIDKLLYAVQNFKYVTNTAGNFSFEDRNNYTFNIMVNDAEGTVKVPKVITARLELLEASGFVQDIGMEIEVNRPKDPKDKPYFVISCPKFQRYWLDAVRHARETIAAALPDYLIIDGLGRARDK